MAENKYVYTKPSVDKSKFSYSESANSKLTKYRRRAVRSGEKFDKYQKTIDKATYLNARGLVRKEKFNSFKQAGSILGLVFMILLLAVLIQRFNGSDNIPSFTSLLEFFTNINPPSIPFVSFEPIAMGDWGIFNFLRDFIYTISQIVNVFVFFCNGLISFCTYVVTFFLWLFAF